MNVSIEVARLKTVGLQVSRFSIDQRSLSKMAWLIRVMGLPRVSTEWILGRMVSIDVCCVPN